MALNGWSPAKGGSRRGGSGAGRWALLVASTAIFAATGYGWARFVVPSYRATSFVVVPPAAAEGPSVDAVMSALRSDEALAAAAAALPPRVSTVLAGEEGAARGADLERLETGLGVEAEAGAPVVAVSFRHRDPLIAEAVANAVGASFVARAGRAAAPAAAAAPARAEPAPDALQDEVLARRAVLAEAENALAAFDAEPVPVAEEPLADAAGRLEAARESAAQARRDLDALEARQAALASLRSGRTAPPGALPQDVGAALSARDARRAEAEALSETYGDNHPRLRRGREDAATAEAALGSALSRAEAALSPDLSRGRAILAELEADERREAAAAEASPPGDPRAERRAPLARGVDEARAALDAALGRWEAERAMPTPSGAGAAAAAPTPAGLIFTEAARPTQPEEQPIVLATAGFGLAGLLGGLLPFLFRRRRPDPGLWQDEPAPPPAVPAEEEPPTAPEEPPAASDPPPARPAAVPGSPRVEELAEAVVASRMTRLLVFGTSAGDGARAAVDLVRQLAGRDGSAVLADLTEGGDAAALMGRTAPRPGLADYVAGRSDIVDIVHQDADSPAHLVSAGEGFDPRLIQGAPPKLVTLMQALEASYGCVVLHLDEPGPRILGALMHEDAALIVAARLDDSLLVADLNDRLADAGSGDAIVLWLDPLAEP